MTPPPARHRIFTEEWTVLDVPELPAVRRRVWRVQIAGQDRPVAEMALDLPGALKMLERRLEVDDYWRRHDPLAELPADRPAPRPWPRWWSR